MTDVKSLQLETLPLEIDGHVYPLRCNMAVLEKLQNGPGEGEIGKLFELSSFQAVFAITEAMIQDACEDDPTLPEVPIAKLKKRYSPAQLARLGIFRLFTRAISPDLPESDEPKPAADKAPENSGN